MIKSLYFLLYIYSRKNNIDFIDAYNAAVMKHKNISSIYSYDKHYDKIPEIERLQP